MSDPTASPAPVASPDPASVLELIEAFRRSKVMFAGVALGLFDLLAAGPKSLDELTQELSADRQALQRLLDATVGLGLIERNGAVYANTPAANAYLVSTSPQQLTGYIRFSNGPLWKVWGQLEDAVREGTHRWQQVYGWDGPLFGHFFRDEASKREFLLGMHGFGVISSPHVVRAFDLSGFQRMVDLGGATGHLVIAACQQYPQLRGCVFDLPEAVSLATEIVSASPVADRIEVAAGDFFTDALPSADIYSLGRILHDWTEEKCVQLLRRIYDSLPAGGAVLLAEKLLNSDKTGPRWANMQDLNMLVCTEGRERTFDEYRELLQAAGFAQVQGCPTAAPIDAVLAVKPA